MLARVTTWEGGTPEGIRQASEEMRANIGQGPPEGLKSTGVTLLTDAEAGRSLMISLFETEADLRESEPVLAAMNPPEGIGRRTGLDVYELAAEARL